MLMQGSMDKHMEITTLPQIVNIVKPVASWEYMNNVMEAFKKCITFLFSKISLWRIPFLTNNTIVSWSPHV